MDTVYAILFTGATVVAMILATLFFFYQQETSRKPARGSPAPASPTSNSPSPEPVTTDTASPTDGHEDADGPVNLSVMPASDDDIWKVWFDQPAQTKGMSKGQFEDSMKVLGTFNTMADFWDRFSGLMHEKLPTKSNVRIFQSNVRPLWEDPLNVKGGKWIVVIQKQKSVGVFNEVLAAMVGGKFECEVSGLVLSKKVREDLVSIWTPSGLPVASLETLRDNISKLLETHLGLKPEITFMSHDKKNKIQIPGKQGTSEKRNGDNKPQAARAPGKFTGAKPTRKTPNSSPSLGGMPSKSPGLGPARPKSPRSAPGQEPSGQEPWAARVERPKTPESRPPENPQAAAPPPKAWQGAPSDKVKAPPPADGEWEVVRSKAKKDKQSKPRDRYRSNEW